MLRIVVSHGALEILRINVFVEPLCVVAERCFNVAIVLGVLGPSLNLFAVLMLVPVKKDGGSSREQNS